MYWDDWKPYLGQDIIFRKKMTGPYDCFAVAENINFAWKYIQETAGNDFSAEMASVSPKASPLKQGRQKRIIPIIEKWEREETCK